MVGNPTGDRRTDRGASEERHGPECEQSSAHVGRRLLLHELETARDVDRGDVERGLFFRGSESLPFGEQIRSVRELLDYLLNGTDPATA